MKLYRLFYIEAGGKITFEDMSAPNDEDAVQIARDMKLAVPSEVWDRRRLVAKIPKHSAG